MKNVIIILLSLLSIIFRGYVLSHLFGWFTDWDIGVAQALGLSIIITMFTHNVTRTRKEDPWDALIGAYALSLVGWGLGYITSLFL